MPRISLDLPTHLIDVPAGRSSERYYIPIYNIPFGGARELISYWLQDCGVIDWQFHNDARSGWICFEYERDFGIALEILQEVKQLHPKLEYSAVNKLRSIKLEVIDCTLTQPRFARIYSSHVKGSLRRWDDLIDWIRLDLPKANVDRTQKILLTGLSSRPNIHELNHWMRSRLGSDCLLIVASRIARIGMCRALVFVCTLAMVKGLSEDRIHDRLEGAMFGNETVRILVERSDGQASATKYQQEAAPLVVLGSSRLPPHWPSIVSKWNHGMERIDEDTT